MSDIYPVLGPSTPSDITVAHIFSQGALFFYTMFLYATVPMLSERLYEESAKYLAIQPSCWK